MRKFVAAKLMAAAGVLASATGMGALGMAASAADPASNSTYNVVGEPYGKAVAILRAQGVPTTFGGSVGSDVPQSQCIVASEKILSTGKIQLMLDCTAEAQPDFPAAPSVANAPTSGAPNPDAGTRPTPGAPGVVSVVPTRVG